MLKQLPPLSLYSHIPWCIRKCPYCDFNSHASGDEGIPEQQYIDSLLADLRAEAHLAQGRPLVSIFFGGGTPSLMSAEGIGKIITGVQQELACSPDMEVTLEANPGTFEQARFAGFQAAGVNRLSIGVQSFDDICLQALGRVHNSDQANAAIDAAKQLGFAHINLDLMHGLPGQTPALAMQDIKQALSHGTDHLSWYQLTLEPNTLFYSQPPELPEEDDLADIQDQGQELLQAKGFKQYEISAWCQPGNEAKHNLNYWRFGDYIGIGAGAHGKLSYQDEAGNLQIQRRVKLRQPKAYMQALSPLSSADLIDPADLPLEFFMNVLRLQNGVEESLYRQVTGLDLKDLSQLQDLRKRGLVRPDRLVTTPLGWRFLNGVLEAFE